MPAQIDPKTKTLKVPQMLCRAAVAERDGDGKIQWMSVASDRPYKRYDWWADEEYWEVLSHQPTDIDTERLKSGLPVCFNHSTNQHLATAGSWKIENGKLSLKYDEFKWASGEFVENKKKDIESGALPHTSVSYELVGEGICTGAKDDLPVYEFRWKPYEAGPVVIPADSSVGPNRERGKVPDEKPREILVRNIDKGQIPANKPTNQPDTKPNEQSHMKLRILSNQIKLAPEGESGGGGSSAAEIEQARGNAINEFKARCKRIDDFVAGMKNAPAKWREKAAELASKHKDADASFEKFHTELVPLLKYSPEDLGGALREEGGVTAFDNLGPGEDSGQRQNPHSLLSVGGQLIHSKDFRACITNGKLKRHFSVTTTISALGLRGKMMLAQRGVQYGQQQRAGFTSSDLSAINLQVIPSLIELGQERLTIMDLISPGTTSAAAIKYPQEQTLGTVDGVLQTDGKAYAAMVAERGLKPNWEPDLTTEVANVGKIAITTKVPDEFLSDFPGFQSYIDARLPRMVDNRAEQQLLYGTGLNDEIKGIMTFGGTLTRIYANSWAETLQKAITDVEVASFFTVDGIAMHPYDWEVAKLEKDLEGRYIAGGPVYIQLGNGAYVEIRTYWGKPVVVTTAVKVGQPIVGCWKLGAQYFIREGMTLASTNANEDDFRRNLLCVRAEERLALADYRPTCFLEITGGPART
jgi:HK97 family phage major capsid protein